MVKVLAEFFLDNLHQIALLVLKLSIGTMTREQGTPPLLIYQIRSPGKGIQATREQTTAIGFRKTAWFERCGRLALFLFRRPDILLFRFRHAIESDVIT